MKKRILTLIAVAVLALSLTACGNNKNQDNNNGNLMDGSGLEDDINGAENGVTDEHNGANGADNAAVNREDCNTVYAEVISVNGDKLSVNAADQVLSLTVSTEMLIDWKEGDEVILYYTGEFGEDMTVRYIDKWTENSEVQRPENKQKTAEEETGGSVIG